MSSLLPPHTSCSVTDGVPASPLQRVVDLLGDDDPQVREMILGGLLGLLEGAPGRASLGRAIAEAVQSLVPCTAEVETLLQKCGALVKEDGAVWRD